MTEPRDDVPLEDLQEQLRAVDAEPETEDAPGAGAAGRPDPIDAVEADEADLAEQSLSVTQDADEDYPRPDEAG